MPDEQDEQVHEAYQYNKLHRGRGEPFLTEFQKEDEALIQHLEDQKVECVCVCVCVCGLSLFLSLSFSVSRFLSLFQSFSHPLDSLLHLVCEGAQCTTCFTGTKIQILTLRTPRRGACGGLLSLLALLVQNYKY